MGTIEFRVLKKAKCVHFWGTGEISFDSLMNRILKVQNHPDFDWSFNSFIDFGDATVSFSEDGLTEYQTFFKKLQQANLPRKWAIYTNDVLTFQTANMSHLLLPGVIEVDVFLNRDRALEFIGITDMDLKGG